MARQTFYLTILKQSGFDVVSPGMTIKAQVAEGQRGLQAVSVIDIDGSTASEGVGHNTSRFKWAQETSDLNPREYIGYCHGLMRPRVIGLSPER